MGNVSVTPTSSPGEVDIEVNLLLLEFTENNLHFVYSPELDIHGYGETQAEAHGMFDDLTKNYLHSFDSEGSFLSDLKKHGWMLSNERTLPPAFTSLMEVNEEFSTRVLNSRPTVTSGRVNFPVFA